MGKAGKVLDPTVIVIFGITGDLAQRYLLPALYHLVKDGLLHPDTEIVGITRRDVSVQSILDKTQVCVLEADKVCDPVALQRFKSHLSVYQMDLVAEASYHELRKHLDDIENRHEMCMNRLYYLAIPAQIFGPVIANLGAGGLNKTCQHGTGSSHVLVEKPFGYDLASAKELIADISKQFAESQVFRIDHYLAKETAQNILTFRFNNPIFEPLWDSRYIRRIDVVAEEKIGIEGRASFYEQTGALRDVVQSHLLQLLALTTMERPESLTSEAIHKAKLALLQDILPVPANKVAERTTRGQYAGYKEEVKNSESTVETFAGLSLQIENARWKGVPIHLRTGKALAERRTFISLTFDTEKTGVHPNVLTFSIQPNDGISIDLCVKRPGFDDVMQTATMDFVYQRTFIESGHPNAYERVLVDAVRGDRTLFATSDEVLASWRIIEPVLEAWRNDAGHLQIYKKGDNDIQITG